MSDNTIRKQDFIKTFNDKHGVIDLNNMSPELQAALTKAGVKEEELKKVAGPDGQIKGLTEFGKLYDLVDRFEGSKPDDSFKEFLDPKVKNPVPTQSKELYDAMDKEITKNRTEARYAQPGTIKAPKQTELTAVKNALVVPAKDQKPAVKLGVEGKDQFDYKDGEHACFKAAAHQCSKFNEKEHGKTAPKLNENANQAIQVAYAEDKAGKVIIDKDQMKLGHDYIDNALDNKLPVNVGVSEGSYFHENYDKITDHFVTIFARGYDDKGRLYYDFKDPGNNGKEGRLYVDKDTGKFFKEATKNRDSGYVADKPWEMTHVMTYIGWP